MTLSNLISVTESTLGSCLVCLLHWVTILTSLCRGDLLHRRELATTIHVTSIRHPHWIIHLSHHIRAHVTNHVIYVAKRVLEERIVCKRISESFKEVIHR